MNPCVVATNKILLQNTLSFNGTVLVRYKIEYPQFESALYKRQISVVNRFYAVRARRFRVYCETTLFDMAVRQYLDDIKNDFPVREFEAMLTYEQTFCADCILSLYFDRYEYTGGAHGNTVRDSQTWNLQSAGLLRLRQIVRCKPNYRTYLIGEANKQIAKDPSDYFDNYPALVAGTFSKNSFYCLTKGVVVYFQQYDIAPYSSGIREFLLPYSDCVISPQEMCLNCGI
ncbi:hypothetical protein SDC9_94840 [bioreactor metagenome]|uniref:Deacetylase PdaC domain-containing protein n=1 Tax=bioreactor metagenome TaxID=1076179 RepID=A0A645A5Y4_9ZZZZ